jgi:histone deacetylase complex regulatory component SIN3
MGEKTKVMFGNLNIYVFFRLYQKMYERLKKAKDLATAKDLRTQRDKAEKERELALQADKQQHQTTDKQLHQALRADNPAADAAAAAGAGGGDGAGSGTGAGVGAGVVSGAGAGAGAGEGGGEGGEDAQEDGGDKEGGEGAGAEGGGEEDEEDMRMAMAMAAAQEEEDLCESYEVARLKGGGGGRGRGGKRTGGRWGKKVVATEEEDAVLLPADASTYQRFLHVLSRHIKGSVDSGEFVDILNPELHPSPAYISALFARTRVRGYSKP